MVSSLSSAPPPLCLDACPGALCLVGWGLALPCSGGESLTAGTGGGPCWAGWCAPFPAWGLCLLGWPLPHSFPQMQGIPALCSAAGPEPVGTPPAPGHPYCHPCPCRKVMMAGRLPPSPPGPAGLGCRGPCCRASLSSLTGGGGESQEGCP